MFLWNWDGSVIDFKQVCFGSVGLCRICLNNRYKNLWTFKVMIKLLMKERIIIRISW